MRFAGRAFPIGRGPVRFRVRSGGSLARAPLAAPLSVEQRRLSSRRARHARSGAIGLGRASRIAWERWRQRPRSFDRRLQPTRFIFQRRATLVRSTPSRSSHATRELPVHSGNSLGRSVLVRTRHLLRVRRGGVPLTSLLCRRSERSGRAPRSPFRESREPIVSAPRETVLLRGSTPDVFHPSFISR